jgi:UDP-2,3-diacylglucosamine pyrophosphatase LpxH
MVDMASNIEVPKKVRRRLYLTKKKDSQWSHKKKVTMENGPSEYRNTTNFSNYEANNKDSTVMIASHYHAKHYLPL